MRFGFRISKHHPAESRLIKADKGDAKADWKLKVTARSEAELAALTRVAATRAVRISDFFRISAFGFRISKDHPAESSLLKVVQGGHK